MSCFSFSTESLEETSSGEAAGGVSAESAVRQRIMGIITGNRIDERPDVLTCRSDRTGQRAALSLSLSRCACWCVCECVCVCVCV